MHLCVEKETYKKERGKKGNPQYQIQGKNHKKKCTEKIKDKIPLSNRKRDKGGKKGNSAFT